MNIRKILQDNKRTVKAKKNILASIVLKGIDSFVYLLLVPVTLGYLNTYEYGIWLTLNSILMWINSFDIGLGNGMRNRLAEAVAKNDFYLGRIYVSTTFFMLIFLMGGLIILGTIAEPFINWYDILNTTPSDVPHLSEIVYVTFVIFCLNFIFKIIGNIYLALQLPAVNNLMVVLGHLISLIAIFILTLTTTGSLFWVAIIYSISPLIIYLLSYPITFVRLFPYLAPTIYCFKRQFLKSLFNIGLQFLILQISSIILFSLTNLIISHDFGPDKVTPYNISFRYFSLVSMAMTIIISPMWSATTDAYAKGDFAWIKKTMRSVRKILYLAYLVLFVMLLSSNWIYKLWIGHHVEISVSLSLGMSIYIAILITSLSYSQFLNGLGKLKLQTVNIIIAGVLFYPLCKLFSFYFGILGIIIAMCLSNLSGLILNLIQFSKVVNGNAIGIWNK